MKGPYYISVQENGIWVVSATVRDGVVQEISHGKAKTQDEGEKQARAFVAEYKHSLDLVEQKRQQRQERERKTRKFKIK